MTEVYMSYLLLDEEHPQVKRDLADADLMHKRVMSLFGDRLSAANPREARATTGALFRLSRGANNVHMVLQSLLPPDCRHLPSGYLIWPCFIGIAIQPHRQIEDGVKLRFSLVANPTRKIDTKTGPDGLRRNGRRVPLRGEALDNWLIRQGTQNGFVVMQAETKPPRFIFPPTRDTQIGVVHVLFEGKLCVTDCRLFCAALIRGIGPGKAYGAGLMLCDCYGDWIWPY